MAFFTLLSQILALLRDRTFAHFFGAGPTLDAYFAAFRIPDTVFAALTLFVSSFALVPLLAGRSAEEQGKVLGPVLLIFGVVAAAIAATLFVAAPVLIAALMPGFAAETEAQALLLTRIMLLQPLLLGLSSIAASIIQASRMFMLFALAPIFYNIGIIAGALFLYPTLGVAGLGWGVVIGAVMHLLVQAVPLFFGSTRLVLGFSNVWLTIRKVVLPSVPRSAALLGNQLLMLIFAGIASVVSVGAVSALSFAFNLQSVPLTVIGVSYAAALFPALSAMVQAGDRAGFSRELWTTVKHVAFWLLPATVLFVVLRAHIVRVILGSGAFSWDDTRLTAAVLALFVLSLLPQALILLFSRTYYASQRTAVPVLVNVGAAIVAGVGAWGLFAVVTNNTTALYFLESLFRVDGIPGTAVLVVPLAYSTAMLLASLVFGLLLKNETKPEGVWLSLGTSFVASVIGGLASYTALQYFGPLLPTNTFFGIFLQGVGAGVVGMVAWGTVLALLRSAELSEVLALLYRKYAKRS